VSRDDELELRAAHDAARLILDRAGLRTYLFEVEPRVGAWAIHVEHPRDGAWHEQTLWADRAELMGALDDRPRREALAARWRRELFERDAA
jgi:hypothetical protein